MVTEMNILSDARQGISWLIFIPRGLAEKNKKNIWRFREIKEMLTL